MKTIFRMLSIAGFVAILGLSGTAFADYSSYSSSDYDPTEGQYIDENAYYNAHNQNTETTNIYTDETYVTRSEYGTVVDGGQPIYRPNGNGITMDISRYYNRLTTDGIYYANYYRGNAGQLLRVDDRPFDIVAASTGLRGGVARTYTNYYWGGPSSISLFVVIIVALLAFAAYRVGLNSTK